MAFKLRCPECRDKFPWTLENPWPRHCPLCGADINNDRADDDIVMPFIRSASTSRNDALYRQMEAGSEFRAQAAAELAGCDVSEMSSLKMTNMNDRADTPIAEILVPSDNEVGLQMLRNPSLGFGGGANPGTALGTGGGKSDVLPLHTTIKNMHPQMVARHTAVTRRG